MNRFLQVGALLAAVCTVAVFAAENKENYPHAYPRKGATKIFENNRVQVWEVNWLKNIPQPIHRHLYDMAGVYLRYGFINVTTPEGKVNPSGKFEVPRPYFQLAGITHKEEAVGGPDDPERLAIMIDLKEPAATGAKANSVPNPAFPREGAKDVLDNPRVREWDYTWEAKKATGPHVFERDAVEVIVTGGTLKRKTSDGKEQTVTLNPKDARFIPQGTIESDELVSGTPRTITFELK
jgi:hypothetical protein